MILLFLDTYYIDGFENSIGGYEVFKDIIIPGIVLIATIRYSISISKKEFTREIDLANRRETEQNNSILKVVKITIPKLIEDLQKDLIILDSFVENCDISSNQYTFFYRPSGTFFKSIAEIGYKKLFEITMNLTDNSEDDFVDFWQALSDAPKFQNNIQEYVEYKSEKFNELNTELNKYFNDLVIQSSDFIKDVFPQRTPTKVTKDQIENDARVRCAYLIYQSLSNFKKLQDQSLVKSKKQFILDLANVKLDPIAAQNLNSKFAQEVYAASSVIATIESLHENSKKSFESFKEQHRLLINRLRKF